MCINCFQNKLYCRYEASLIPKYIIKLKVFITYQNMDRYDYGVILAIHIYMSNKETAWFKIGLYNPFGVGIIYLTGICSANAAILWDYSPLTTGATGKTSTNQSDTLHFGERLNFF